MVEGWLSDSRAGNAHGDASAETPLAALWLFAGALAITVLAVLTGSLDVTLPSLTSGTRFALAYGISETAGPAGLFLYILAHNWGVALVVPTLGILFAAVEPNPRNKRWVIDIMAASTLLALIWGPIVVKLDITPEVVVLFILEAAGVLVVSLGARGPLRRLIEAGRLKGRHGIAQGFAASTGYIVASLLVLSAAAFLEVVFLLESPLLS